MKQEILALWCTSKVRYIVDIALFAAGIVCERDFNVMRPRAGFDANAAFYEPVGISYNPSTFECQAGFRPHNISSLRLKLFIATEKYQTLSNNNKHDGSAASFSTVRVLVRVL